MAHNVGVRLWQLCQKEIASSLQLAPPLRSPGTPPARPPRYVPRRRSSAPAHRPLIGAAAGELLLSPRCRTSANVRLQQFRSESDANSRESAAGRDAALCTNCAKLSIVQYMPELDHGLSQQYGEGQTNISSISGGENAYEVRPSQHGPPMEPPIMSGVPHACYLCSVFSARPGLASTKPEAVTLMSVPQSSSWPAERAPLPAQDS